jgi:hypothetical protein
VASKSIVLNGGEWSAPRRGLSISYFNFILKVIHKYGSE